MKSKNTKLGIYNIITEIGIASLYCFIILTLYTFVFDYNYALLKFRFLVLILGGICGVLGHLRKINIKVLAFIYIFSLVYIFTIIIGRSGYYEFDLFWYSFSYMCITLNLLDHNLDLNATKILYYVSMVIFLFRIIVMRIPIREFLKDGSSYNYISVLALLPLGLYLIALAQNKKNVPIGAAVIYFIITIISYGRGGIVTGGMLITLSIFQSVNNIKRKDFKYLLIACLGLFLILILNTNIYTWFVSLAFKKFVLLGNDAGAGRIEYWTTYIRLCGKNFYTFLVGYDPYVIRSDGNLHNSFLQCYAYFGLPFFIICLVCLIKTIRLSTQKNETTLFILVIVLCLRAFTDKLFFQGYCEIYLYYLIFYALYIL